LTDDTNVAIFPNAEGSFSTLDLIPLQLQHLLQQQFSDIYLSQDQHHLDLFSQQCSGQAKVEQNLFIY